MIVSLGRRSVGMIIYLLLQNAALVDQVVQCVGLSENDNETGKATFFFLCISRLKSLLVSSLDSKGDEDTSLPAAEDVGNRGIVTSPFRKSFIAPF